MAVADCICLFGLLVFVGDIGSAGGIVSIVRNQNWYLWSLGLVGLVGDIGSAGVIGPILRNQKEE